MHHRPGRVDHPASERLRVHFTVAELTAPSVLCLTETWADKGLPTERMESQTLTSRRDRADGPSLRIPRLQIAVGRLIIRSDHGCWCRPPAPGEVDTIRSFKKEGQLHAANVVGCVVLCDLNVHHRKWLNYSNRNSLEGQELCLLDLVLLGFPGVKAGVLPLIATSPRIQRSNSRYPHKSWPSARYGCSGTPTGSGSKTRLLRHVDR